MTLYKANKGVHKMMQLRAHNAQGDNFNYCVYCAVSKNGSTLKLSVLRNSEEGTEELYNITANSVLEMRTKMRKKKLRMMQVLSGAELLVMR